MGYIPSGRPNGRPRQFYKYELPHGVVKIVSAQCADFMRKELAISEGDLAADILDHYRSVNGAIKQALEDIEDACRDGFLLDIAENRGYDRSQISTLFSRKAYYSRKRKAIYDIAKRLRLI